MKTGVDLQKKIIPINKSINLKLYTNDDMIFSSKAKILSHQKLVNKFAKKIGKSYPNHDASKLEGHEKYAYAILWKNLDESNKEKTPKIFSDDIYCEAKKFQINHHISSPHHIEHWCDYDTTDPFNGKKMPLEYIQEMCCDWSAVSARHKEQSAIQWFKKNIGKMFIFEDNQIKFIYETIKQIET